jgi:hypothetical protein
MDRIQVMIEPNALGLGFLPALICAIRGKFRWNADLRSSPNTLRLIDERLRKFGVLTADFADAR